jgi:serine/threonine protein kinase/tetratricopeptide (TPR) repeat protein
MPNCPRCGQELGFGDPAGLCPQCLIQGAFDSSVGADESGTQTIAAAADTDDDFVRYHILRLLGEGGMGTVYLAEQREPIRRHVALKVVKLGMDTSQVLARFANERQALAMMDHPNIARIFDAGATAKGRPYFVMEYIEGVPITQYCDRNRIAIGQRLELFLAVCRAVQHAHQKGVIHRDLKPSNVLVAEQEGTPLPKVIDFGIAKATDRWAVETTLLTQFGQMVGTPEYASPEQAEVTTGDVDESSDVYSLGVILYELLVGTVPYDAASMRQAGLSEMLRVIREEEAPPLSRKLTTMGAAAAEIAAHRQTDVATLRRLVDGDLNSIAMKALEKVRERRYPSVTEFAADIQRYVEDRPVLASPPSRVYRARKFLRRHKPAAFGTALGLALILLSGVTVWSLMRGGSPPTPKLASTLAGTVANRGTIVLGEFANATGDPAFGTLRQVMAGELGKSPYLSVLSDARMSETLRLMVRPVDTKLTSDVASEICERTESAAVVDGSVTSLGGQYLLSLHARNCRTGDVLDQEQAPAGKKEDVFKVLGEVANRFQTWAGTALPSVAKEPSLPAEATTRSLEAWRSYSAAMKAQQRSAQSTEVIQLLRRATEIDPKFAMAYSNLGRLYASFGESELGAQNIAKGYELRNGVSDEENYFITFNYHRQVSRNLELARQTLESWVQEYPRDINPHGFLAAFTTQGSGHYDKAAEEGLKAIELDPDYSIGYANVAFAYIYENRLREAEALLHKAAERKIETVEFSLCRYFIAFLRNDQPAMEKEVTRRQSKLEAQGWFEHQEALTLAYRGRLEEAARLSDRAVSLSRQAGLRERASLIEGARAVWSALFGMREEGQRNAAAALSSYRSRDADYGPAFALELLHESAKARKIKVDLAMLYPEDTSVQFSYLPALRALEALNQPLSPGNAAKAIEMTQVATPYDLAVPGTAFYSGAFFGAMYPVYVRGLVYSRMGRHRQAAVEFQKILDHPGIMLNDPMGPMARLQLARALAASGDRAKAAAVYKDLLTIWKDADPDLPVVQEAKAESAKQP